MKHLLALLVLAFALPASAGARRVPDRVPAAEAEAAGAAQPVLKIDGPKVHYSFDRYAGNANVVCKFISEGMLRSAQKTSLASSGTWDFNQVINRLTSLLTLHTHSTSVTRQLREDLRKVSAKKQYELIMHSRENGKEIYVFRHPRGKGKMDELLIFRFRNTYCSRVVQLTGDLKDADVERILRM